MICCMLYKLYTILGYIIYIYIYIIYAVDELNYTTVAYIYSYTLYIYIYSYTLYIYIYYNIPKNSTDFGSRAHFLGPVNPIWDLSR